MTRTAPKVDALPTELSRRYAVCCCGLSWSYSLTFFDSLAFLKPQTVFFIPLLTCTFFELLGHLVQYNIVHHSATMLQRRSCIILLLEEEEEEEEE